MKYGYLWVNHRIKQDCKWLFKVKLGIEGVEKPRFKARLVAKGYTQVEGIDFTEVFSLVLHHTSVRILRSLVVTHVWS